MLMLLNFSRCLLTLKASRSFLTTTLGTSQIYRQLAKVYLLPLQEYPHKSYHQRVSPVACLKKCQLVMETDRFAVSARSEGLSAPTILCRQPFSMS
jgi:hypothetical protein